MRISAKGRYALSTMVYIASQSRNEKISSVLTIANALGISKIFLEQIALSLKKSGLIISVKGARGGYLLSRPPAEISVYDILLPVETALAEQTESSFPKHINSIDATINILVFSVLNDTIKTTLSDISLEQLLDYADTQGSIQAYMPNI